MSLANSRTHGESLKRRQAETLSGKATGKPIWENQFQQIQLKLLLSAGENPKVVSERLGHASIVLTLDTYSHVLPTTRAEKFSKNTPLAEAFALQQRAIVLANNLLL